MRSSILSALGIAAFGIMSVSCNAQQQKEEVKLERIKAADVEKAVAAHKGKVVVLDVWGEF